jgi:hypothetical protein
MTATKAGDAAKEREPLKVTMQTGEDEAAALARIGLDPAANAMATARLFTRGSFGELSEGGLYQALGNHVAEAKGGDLSRQRAMLAAQSFTLNSIFTEMARRAALNMGEYVGAAETYMRLALKAQSQSRATIEALDRLVKGREQTVKHVHVDNRGGQAVIADTVQTGGEQNGERGKQPHALESHGAASGQPLRSADAERAGVPIARHA